MSHAETSTAELPADDQPTQAEWKRFQAVLQALLPKRSRPDNGSGPNSSELAQSELGETHAGHTVPASADSIDSVAAEILPAKPPVVPEPKAGPELEPTSVDSQHSGIGWIVFAAVVAALLSWFVWSGIHRGELWERLGVAVVAMLTLGAAYGVWGRPRVAPPEPEPQPQPSDHLPVSRWPPSSLVFPLRDPEELPATEPPPASRTRRLLIALLTLFSWALVAIWNWPNLTMTWVLLTVVVHEVGHWWAWRRVGARDAAIIFIPFLGGMAIGNKPNTTPGERLFVVLMGPAPGLLLGCLIYVIDSWLPVPSSRELAFNLVAINLSNLLPIWPLDGGRIAWELLARRSALAQAMLSVCSLVGTVLLIDETLGNCFIFALLWGLFVHGRPKYQEATAALAFQRQYGGSLPSLNELSERQLWNLYVLVNRRSSTQTDVQTTAHLMRRALNRAREIPHSPAPAWPWIAVGALWLLAAGTAFQTKLASDWDEFQAEMRRQIDAQTAAPTPPKIQVPR